MDDRSLPGRARTCPSCRSTVEPGHKFCPACGARVPELPLCKSCGAQFIAPVKFCEMCGAPADPAAVAAKIGAKQEEAVEPVYEGIPEPEPEDEAIPEEPGIAAEDQEPVFEDEEPGADVGGMPEPAAPLPSPKLSVKTLPAGSPAVEPLPVETKTISRPVPDEGTGVSGTDPLSPAFSGLSDGPERKAPAPKPFPMNKVLVAGGVVLVLLIVAAAVWFAGLPMLSGGGTLSSATPLPPSPAETKEPAATALPATMPPTPVPTSIPVPVPTTEDQPAGTAVPESIPENQIVYFDVQKDQVSAKITTIYQRGPGENVLNYAEVKVTYPDGTVKSGFIQPSKGDTELVLQGSKGVDHAVVTAMLHNGKSYVTNDEMLAFQASKG